MCIYLQIYAGELQYIMLQDGKSFAEAPLGLIQTHFIIRRKRTRFKYSSDVKLSRSRDLWKSCFKMCPISQLDLRDSNCECQILTMIKNIVLDQKKIHTVHNFPHVSQRYHPQRKCLISFNRNKIKNKSWEDFM